MSLVSIIIPVYAVEKYISKCLISVKNQTYRYFECIVVDDGSPDNSTLIGKNAVSNDSRFKFFYKENGGLSDARNFGLDRAKGEYVCFLDSDDYYNSDFIEKMLKSANENNSDIVVCNTNFVSESGEIIKKHSNRYSSYISGYAAFNDLMISKNLLCIVPDKMFRRVLFENVRFPVGVYYEDRATTHKLFLISEKISFVSNFLFNYCQRLGSITNSLNNKHIKDRIVVMELIECFLKKEKIFQDHQEIFVICYLLNVYLAGGAMIAKNSGCNKYFYTYLFSISDSNYFTYRNILLVRKTSYIKMLALFALKFNYILFFVSYKIFFR